MARLRLFWPNVATLTLLPDAGAFVIRMVPVAPLCATAALALLCTASPIRAQVPEAAASLVARIHAFGGASPAAPGRGDAPEFGSGIAFAAPSPREILLVTAKHVVEGADSLAVYLRSAPDEPRAGELRWATDPAGFDVAVVSIPVEPEDVARIRGSFDRLGRPGRLRPGSPVFPVGCPDDECWTAPAPADRVLTSLDLILEFQSTFVSGGSSGGALFDENWELVGMVLRNDMPRAEAIPVDALLEIVDSLALEVAATAEPPWPAAARLQRPVFPRGGYAWTAGVSLLLPIRDPGVPSALLPAPGGGARLPSFRATVSRQTASGPSWHVSGLRLAPGNVALIAATAGLARDFRTGDGRLLLRLFGEAGGARSEIRHDVGGYFVDHGGGEQTYVPVWRREERDGLGVGGGLTLEYALFPHTILELTVAGWSFGMPENAPEVPLLYFGGGLRLGR